MTRRESAPADLATIRRFEAAGFRAWPATSVHYDGTWAIRLTASHPARRLNSVNPLDPGDDRRIGERTQRAARRFATYGRPLTFRLSPLASPAIARHFDAEGWSTLSHSIVMRLALDEAVIDEALDQIPLKDMNRFINAALKVHGQSDSLRPGLTEVISSIRPEAGLFALEEDGEPVATAVCVLDGELAGLFEIASDPAWRGRGYGRRVLLSALKWAHLRGARLAWLQVEADNTAACGLYRSLGFAEVYRYHYRQPAGS